MHGCDWSSDVCSSDLAIFLGAWTPEAVGDYVAGPNHTLPTGGTARYEIGRASCRERV